MTATSYVPRCIRNRPFMPNKPNGFPNSVIVYSPLKTGVLPGLGGEYTTTLFGKPFGLFGMNGLFLMHRGTYDVAVMVLFLNSVIVYSPLKTGVLPRLATAPTPPI